MPKNNVKMTTSGDACVNPESDALVGLVSPPIIYVACRVSKLTNAITHTAHKHHATRSQSDGGGGGGRRQ